MAYRNNILLGRITRVSGYEGAVTVKLEKIFAENIPQMESVFLEIEGKPVPFFISDLEYSGADILKLWFEGYDSADQVSEFTGCRIFLTNEMIPESHITDNDILIGYEVYTKDNNLIGTISEIMLNNGQWLLNILSPHKKVTLIPYHEDFIFSIDRKKKNVIMDIPEGLLEIN
jgi:16S rRNA processing protein RimM